MTRSPDGPIFPIESPSLLFRHKIGYTLPVRVLGIDCGTEFTGYGVVDQLNDRDLHYVCCGTIKLSPKRPMPERLSQVNETLRNVIDEFHPDMVAIEDVFYAVNAKSALKLGQVRGVAMFTAAACGLQVAEYAPLSSSPPL